ncbi:hypothetical protein FPE01S_02_03210 [Flavihumibacter petaseus NBRC 106054]|uniref:Uncharacterized protein n=1 Tax=Flavihumibacter petaseus NBRC 106054 TaxID=1220578 RepID=A0A0E9MZN3_9BACT|nr:hypothetical protein FPE01S_02_03210 [Flavihumibacter petaseus NBRC 106054]
MRLIRKLISNLLFLLPFFTQGQSQDKVIDIFQLKQTSFFKETNSFKSDSTFTIRQKVFYNEPYKKDEEYSHLLTITIFDNSKLDSTNTFNLEKDASAITCSYDKSSVWNWHAEKTSISGQVTIISKTAKKAKLKFEITVLDSSHQTKLVYTGIRTFNRVKTINNLY